MKALGGSAAGNKKVELVAVKEKGFACAAHGTYA
jgi:hypothetical protein